MEKRSEVSFFINDEKVTLVNPDPTMTVLDYLREEANKRGTKEGCREGDCGACTVVVARRENGQYKFKAVNSCILFLPTLDEAVVFTVEALDKDGLLHPVQQAMVDNHGSQCGFCTPGFVMSIFAAWASGATVDKRRLCEIVAGNLCRCTGYGPIIAAGLESLSEVDSSALAAFLAATKSKLGELKHDHVLAIDYDCPRRLKRFSYFVPKQAKDLLEILLDNDDVTILAGGTDVGLWVTKQSRQLPVLVDINRIAEFQKIEISNDHLLIGGAVTLTNAREALAAWVPRIDAFVSRFASEQIRNSGTIGGNIANGSPIGDMPPALIALGATIELIGHKGSRSLPLENFFIAYGKQDRRSDEVLAAISIPEAASNMSFRVYKISKRLDQDISAVCGAFAVTLVDGVVDDARICFGGMAETPKRAQKCETFLIGKEFSAENIDEASKILEAEYHPITDMRASADYRIRVCGSLLRKFYSEITGDSAGGPFLEEMAA